MRKENVEPLFIEDLVRFGEDRGLEKGLEKGRAEGLEKGHAEGLEQGQVEMARRALLVILEARGFVLTEAERARVGSERSVDRLLEWHRRAVTATSVVDALS